MPGFFTKPMGFGPLTSSVGSGFSSSKGENPPNVTFENLFLCIQNLGKLGTQSKNIMLKNARLLLWFFFGPGDKKFLGKKYGFFG